jgi:penicillin-binding protein 2
VIQLPEDRRPPLTPQLARRVAIIGGFALAMFAIIFFRLWFLQVLSGQNYLAQASVNRTRQIRVPAERGEILDSNGNLLVTSRQTTAIQIAPQLLPDPVSTSAPGDPPPPTTHADAVIYRRLAHLLGISLKRSKCPVAGHRPARLATIPCIVAQQTALAGYANVTIKTDVPWQVRDYIEERQERFRGVQVQPIYVRRYPLHTLAAQLFGTIGPITHAELNDKARYRGVSRQAVVGQSGLEWYYDQYLRGTDGSEKVQIDSLGHFTRRLKGTAPTPGDNLQLSLNTKLQRVGEAALAQSIASNPPATGGAFVAMNPENGQIYAMGSNPSFDPNTFTKPIPTKEFDQKFGASQGYPLINRAIQSGYPTGSTFKGITATAALNSGVWTTGETYDDTGTYTQDGPADQRHNAGNAAYGVLDITQAIMVSSDNFFYNLGRLLNSDAPDGGKLQAWARRFGMGAATGVDLGGENAGILPTPKWRAARNKLEANCDRLTHPDAEFPHHPYHRLPPGGCGIADGTNRPWSVGDNENLAVGQGDLEATPLQLAVAYSAIENNGHIVRPHVGMQVTSPQGTVLQKINPPFKRTLHWNESDRAAILTGLRDAASVPGGTSADVFGSFPKQVYGKTGTAQLGGGKADQAWYVCFVPSWATKTPILVAVTVEQGGFGAVGAAPVAREILSQWFFKRPGQYVAGASHTL